VRYANQTIHGFVTCAGLNSNGSHIAGKFYEWAADKLRQAFEKEDSDTTGNSTKLTQVAFNNVVRCDSSPSSRRRRRTPSPLFPTRHADGVVVESRFWQTNMSNRSRTAVFRQSQTICFTRCVETVAVELKAAP